MCRIYSTLKNSHQVMVRQADRGKMEITHRPFFSILLLLEESLREWHHLAGSRHGSQLISPYDTRGGR